MAISEVISSIEHNTARQLGLRRIETGELAIERSGKLPSFSYSVDGKPVGRKALQRIRELVIPPAWSEVRIAADPAAHVQAVGRDEAGRLQYIYHDSWEDVRAATKLHRLIQLGDCLAPLREAVARDIDNSSPKAPLAAATRLIDLLHLRAGHEGYAGNEGGRGVATLLKRHLSLSDSKFRLRFRGKGGKLIDKTCEDAALLAALVELRKIRGQRLFKLQSDGAFRPMTANHLNQYLFDVAKQPISAKDFRTFYASSRALDLLARCDRTSKTAKMRAITATCRDIAEDLENTPAVVRKSYIHPSVLLAFGGDLPFPPTAHARQGLTGSESQLMRFLEREQKSLD